MAIKKKKRLFDFFNHNNADRPDAPKEDTTPTVKRYFKLLGRRFWQLITLNAMMLPMIAPVLVGIYLYMSMPQTPTANEVIFPQLYAVGQLDTTPASTFLLDLYGAQLNIPAYGGSAWIYVGIAICALFLFVTFGWQNVGSSYILRNMVLGEPVFIWSDYFYAIKRNLRQGLLFGMLDFAIIATLAFDIWHFSSQVGSFWQDLGFYASIAIAILYFLMRFYLYLLLVTFELSIRKILKNALIFTMLGIKRNLMAVLWLLLMTGINIALFFLFAMTPLGIAIPLILPFLYYLSFTAFTTAYAAYPVIDRYMIAPYMTEDAANPEEESISNSTDETDSAAE